MWSNSNVLVMTRRQMNGRCVATHCTQSHQTFPDEDSESNVVRGMRAGRSEGSVE